MTQDSLADKSEKTFKTLANVISNYRQMEESIVAQLNFQVDNHPTTIGGFREDIWRQFFAQTVPKKYVIEQSVFIIDSEGNVSKEVDLAIFDEMYTPYIFHNGRIKFIPVEAVAAVVQSKSYNPGSTELKDWLDRLCLKTSRNAIARMAFKLATQNPGFDTVTQTATRPIKILCRLGTENKKAAEGFDFCLAADNGSKRIDITAYPQNNKLFQWFNELNHAGCSDATKQTDGQSIGFYDQDTDQGNKQDEGYKHYAKTNHSLDDYRITSPGKQEVSLLSFKLMFNQLLMLINNPMLFPHMAYAELFRDVYGKMEDETEPARTAQTEKVSR